MPVSGNAMKYLFEILGENESLGKAEVTGVLDAHSCEYEKIEDDEGLLVMETSLSENTFARRLGLTRVIDKHLISGNLGSIMEYFEKADLGEKTFCVRARRIRENMPEISASELQKRIGGILSKRYKVELEEPDIEIRVLISKKLHTSIKLEDIGRKGFEDRRVQFRPFFSPISLHPKLARALVNLSRVKEGDLLLDPFCGTGGILIEGAMIGSRIVGSDVSGGMVKGCKKNLEASGHDGMVFESDISDIASHVAAVDAIATDPPYGRSASTGGEDIRDLYERSFVTFKKVLKKGGHVATILPNVESQEIGARHFRLKESYEVRVHGSLTRYFTLYEHA
jgi:tRNA (guanine10-N2)-dimethyltransferase